MRILDVSRGEFDSEIPSRGPSFQTQATVWTDLAFSCYCFAESRLVSTAVDIYRVSEIVFRGWYCLW